MKFKVAFFVVFLFLTIFSVKAQPGCSTPVFNPFDTYYYGDVDFVIYGSSSEFIRLNDWVKFTSGGIISRDKLKIQVNEELKGKIGEKQIEAYVSYDCLGQVGGMAVYKLKRAYIDDSPVWIIYQVSSPMNYPKQEYSQQGVAEVLAKIRSDLATNNEHNLFGIVVEKFGDEFSYTESDEIKRKLGYHKKNFKPMIGITVEAKRKSDSKIYKTKTDNDGKFKFTGLADGEYQVYPILPDFYKTLGFNMYPNDRHSKVSLYVPVKKNWANGRQVFELETFGNLTGKIDNIFPEFQRGMLKIWKVVSRNGKLEYREFWRKYLPLNSEQTAKSENSITFNFSNFPTGKYILAISYGRTIYYSGVGEKETAKIFEVKKGEPTEVSFKIP